MPRFAAQTDTPFKSEISRAGARTAGGAPCECQVEAAGQGEGLPAVLAGGDK